MKSIFLIIALLISITGFSQSKKAKSKDAVDTVKIEKPVYTHLSISATQCYTPRENFLVNSSWTEQEFINWVNGIRSNKAPMDTTKFNIYEVRLVVSEKEVHALTFEQFIKYVWHPCN